MRVLVAATSKSARGDRDRIAPGRHDALDHLAVTRYDVAVLDWDLPRVHGEVCRRLAAERSQSRILWLRLGVTARGSRRDIEAAETVGQAILARSQAGLCEEELVPHLDAIVIHCRQPAALAGFYAEVLGLPVAPADVAAIEAGTLGPDESVLLGSRDALHVWLTPVRALEPVPGRVHLDVRLDVAGDLDRLIALGATRQWQDPKGCWTVLADPEGNLFCAMYPAT